MRNYVIINGVNSLTIQGLAINNLPPITKPMIRTQREEIDGRDGDIVTELGYSAYDKQMEIGLYGNFDIDAIIKYFTGEGTIVFSNEADKYYNFKILDQIDYEKLLKFKTAIVTLHCQPFKYPVDETPIEGEAIEITGSGSNITLENTVVAPMEMKVKGNTLQNGTPTPDYPQEIHTVSGDNSIDVCGKNFFNINGTKTNFNDYIYKYTYTLKPNTKYTISSNVPSSTTANIYANGTSSATNIVYLDNSKTITSNSNGEFYVLVRHLSTGETGVMDVYSAIINGTYYLQIEEGTTATTYEEYKSASYPISLGVENLAPINWASNFVSAVNNLNQAKIIIKDNKNCLYYTPASGYNAYDTKNLSLGMTFKENTQYTLSFDWLKETATSPTLDIEYTDGTITTVAAANNLDVWEHKVLISTANKTIKYIRPRYTAGITYIDISSWQIIEGTTEKTSTRSPIELCKIGTYQDKIDKSTGKNLFNDTLRQGVTDYVQGIWTSTTTRITSTEWTILPAGTYTVNCKTSTSKTVWISNITFDTNGNYYNIPNISGIWLAPPITITFPVDTKWKMNVSYADYSNITPSEIYNIQVLKGEYTSSTMPSYEPYGTSWYLKKEIGKVVLDGTINGAISSIDNYGLKDNVFAMNIIISNIISGNSSLSAYSENYHVLGTGSWNQWYSTASNVTLGDMSKNSNGTGVFVGVPKEYNSTNLGKQYLASNPSNLYYQLATPTYETITDTTLIGQLEALKPYSYNPVTNITQTNNDAPFELDVSLLYTNTMNVNNVGNIYAKPILTIEGSGTIGIILNDIEVLSVDLGTDEKITIDVPKLEAYNPDDDTLLNRLVTGDYMKLLINDGDNTIAFSGSVTSATLTNYTRYI